MPSGFIFPKPMNWKYMPLFEKIAYSVKYQTPDYIPYIDKLESKCLVEKMCGSTIRIP